MTTSTNTRLWSVAPIVYVAVVVAASPPSNWVTKLGVNGVATFLLVLLLYHTLNVMKPW